jgi:hypothetical protein
MQAIFTSVSIINISIQITEHMQYLGLKRGAQVTKQALYGNCALLGYDIVWFCRRLPMLLF